MLLLRAVQTSPQFVYCSLLLCAASSAAAAAPHSERAARQLTKRNGTQSTPAIAIGSKGTFSHAHKFTTKLEFYNERSSLFFRRRSLQELVDQESHPRRPEGHPCRPESRQHRPGHLPQLSRCRQDRNCRQHVVSTNIL